MKHKKTKGFTLIELLIYIALVSGILIAATSFAWNIINSRWGDTIKGRRD